MRSMTGLLLATMLSLGLGSVAAAGPGGRGGPCKDEIREICPDARGHEMRECVDANLDALSAECQERVAMRRARMEERREACAGDVETLCPDAEPGRELRHCMRENRDRLSEGCAATRRSH